jgi:histidyl-tRNA synthetase
MNDILPEQTPLWRYFESTVARLLDNYGYKQSRRPLG